MFQQVKLPNVILYGLTVLVVVLGVFLFLSPPALFPDPADGFKVMRSMEMGGGFNRLISPDQDDLTKNSTEFLTWWSPGQYLLPYSIKHIFGINTGQATALAITICQLFGIWGFYRFFRKIGFSDTVAALSILFIACQQLFVQPYVFYSGGEVLLFAFLGWFLYGCVAVNHTGRRMTIIVLLSGLIGFFCKSSFMWMYAAGLLFLWIRLSTKQPLATWLWNGLWIGIPAIVAIAFIWLSFLSKGQNPASVASGIKFSLNAFSFPIASPLLAGFSIDDICNGLIFHNGKPLFSSEATVIIVAGLALISLWLVYRLIKKAPNPDYGLLIAVFFGAAIIFFTTAYLRQMTISYETRHFRVIGLIIVPGIIYMLSNLSVAYRVPFVAIAACIAVASVIYASKGYSYNKNKSAHGPSGFAQQGIDQKALDGIIALDKQNHNAIFVFVSESLPLEIKHNRVLSLQPIGENLTIDYEDYEQSGHAGPLYIILPESYAGPKEKMILKAFPDYNRWYGSMLSANTVMYAAP